MSMQLRSRVCLHRSKSCRMAVMIVCFLGLIGFGSISMEQYSFGVHKSLKHLYVFNLIFNNIGVSKGWAATPVPRFSVPSNLSVTSNDCMGDTDGDGDVDGADIAVLAAQLDSPGDVDDDLYFLASEFGKNDCPAELPEINFDKLSISAQEGDTALVEIQFTKSYTGALTVALTGTLLDEDHGLSCTTDGDETLCSVPVAGGDTPQIEIPLSDNGFIEEMKWLGIQLKPVDGAYQVGALAQCIVAISDNDTVWDGVFTTQGEEIGFSIEVIRQGAVVTGRLQAEGGGILPAGAENLNEQEREFSVYFDVNEESFSATLPEVTLPGADTLLNAEGKLWLELEASSSTGKVSADSVQGDKDKGSASTLHMTFPGYPHLDQDIAGSFVIQRRPTAPSSQEVSLEPVVVE